MGRAFGSIHELQECALICQTDAVVMMCRSAGGDAGGSIGGGGGVPSGRAPPAAPGQQRQIELSTAGPSGSHHNSFAISRSQASLSANWPQSQKLNQIKQSGFFPLTCHHQLILARRLCKKLDADYRVLTVLPLTKSDGKHHWAGNVISTEHFATGLGTSECLAAGYI